MRISIRGKNDKLTKKEIRYAVNVIGEHLFEGSRVFNNINIYIKNKDFSLWNYGYCIPLDFDKYYHREFEILLNRKSSPSKQILTLAHEMVHIKQYALGDLKQYSCFLYKWMGKKIEVDEEDYHVLPWEKQAHKLESGLVEYYNTKKYEDAVVF